MWSSPTVTAGSTSPGTDLFGREEWEGSLLHEVLFNQGLTPLGHSPDEPPNHPIVYVGRSLEEAEGTATPEVTPTP